MLVISACIDSVNAAQTEQSVEMSRTQGKSEWINNLHFHFRSEKETKGAVFCGNVERSKSQILSLKAP